MSSLDPITSRGVDCCVSGLWHCAALNTTAMKVILLVIGCLSIGLGIYGAIIAPHMWGSYVVIGLGGVAFLLDLALVLSKLIVNALRREPPARGVPRTPIVVQSPGSQAPVVSQPPRSQIPVVSQPSGSATQRRFHISQLFEAENFKNLPEIKTADFKVPDEMPISFSCPQFVLDVFDEKNAPILRIKNEKGKDCCMMRVSFYIHKNWVEDNCIELLPTMGDWMAKTSPMQNFNSEMVLSTFQGQVAQQKWFTRLIKGEELSLPDFFSPRKGVDYNVCTCRLWSPDRVI